MRQNQLERGGLAEPPLTRGGCGAEPTALVKVLTDFLQGASRYVMEDDGGPGWQEPTLAWFEQVPGSRGE